MINSISERYFEIIRRCFPVMSGSDEFYFFPRLESDNPFAERFDKDELSNVIKDVQGLHAELDTIGTNDLDEEIDSSLLKISIRNFLFHFNDMPFWRRDPVVYLKLLIAGLDQSRFPMGLSQDRMFEWLESRISSLAGMLRNARSNLDMVPDIYRETGIEMISDLAPFLTSVMKDMFYKWPGLEASFQPLHDALDLFGEHLENLSASGHASAGRELLERILKENYGWHQGLEDAREVIESEKAKTEAVLSRRAKEISGRDNPDELLSSLMPPPFKSKEILEAYGREVEETRIFLLERGLIKLDCDPGVRVEFTPRSMRAVRSAAAYAAPSGLSRGPGRYYILPLPGGRRSRDQIQRLELIHRQIRFVTSHETYPGHHLLDIYRLSNPSPIRRAVELPLFYEGWACYSETLIVKAGYVKNPVEAMLLEKRRWLRAIRGLADLEFQTGAVDINQAAGIIGRMGMSARNALEIARRFALNPGYQMCYTLGTAFFYALAEEFRGTMDECEFHDLILRGGELPLELVRSRLRRISDARG